MADHRQGPPVPPKRNLDPNDFTSRFEDLLRTRRLNDLADRSHRRTESPEPVHHSSISSGPPSRHAPRPPPEQPNALPAYSSLRNHPKIATPPHPQDSTSLRFCSQLRALSVRPTKYENPGLLDEALQVIPLDQIYGEAEDESSLLQAQAASIGGNAKPEWGYQDCVVRALLRWFKRSFFSYVLNPPCSHCGMPTVRRGYTPPSADEVARGATKVELYQCSDGHCGGYERFPRYGDVWALLQTRKGRAGEWTDCFTMLCRAMAVRARYVWNSEDLCWTEVYSEHHKRWIHVDPCEETWDNPRMYAEGWGRKIGYCIAFAMDGATDVTRRYVRNASTHGAERNRAPEEVLLWIINEIRKTRRENIPKEERRRLIIEDEKEEKELRGYVIQALATSIGNSLSGQMNIAGQEPKHPTHQTGAAIWQQAQTDDPSFFPGPDGSPRDRP